MHEHVNYTVHAENVSFYAGFLLLQYARAAQSSGLFMMRNFKKGMACRVYSISHCRGADSNHLTQAERVRTLKGLVEAVRRDRLWGVHGSAVTTRGVSLLLLGLVHLCNAPK